MNSIDGETMSSRAGETIYRKSEKKKVNPKKGKEKAVNPKPKGTKKGKEKVVDPKPEKVEQQAMQDIDQESEITQESTRTSHQSRPRLKPHVLFKFEKILKAINEFGEKHHLSLDIIKRTCDEAYSQVVNSRELRNISQERLVSSILKNIAKNINTAKDPTQLLYNIDLGETEAAENDIIDGIEQSEQSYMSVPTIAEMQVDEEPKLSDGQIKHIEDVVKILENEPKLKNDIKRTIVEELTKGYINPEQFKHYSQEIEKAQIKNEAPEAIRGKKSAKPKAKKSAQPNKEKKMDIDITTSKQTKTKPKPKPKPKKTTQKQKPKVVTL